MERGERRDIVACLAAVAALLLCVAPTQAVAASARGFSLTPTTTEPYAVCGLPTHGHSACLAILVPSASRGSAPAAPGAAVAPSFSGTGVGGGFAPADLRSAYALPSASAGSGQTVAIVDAYDDPNAESDLATYRSRYGISACTTANGCFKKVNQTGGSSLPKAEAGWAVEISLDLDMVSAACPNCHLLLVEANTNEDVNLYAAEDEAVTLGATEISDSWAGEEYPEETETDVFFNHPGVPITVAAGDSGYGVQYPAASPDVISVGGTKLTPASNSRKWTETAWSKTGSGCSAYEPKPAWQSDKGCSRRTDNDVAMVASPESPLSVADSYKLPAEFSKPEAGWTLVGGTSASSPLMAGTLALSSAHTRSLPGAEALYDQAAASGTGVLDDVISGSDGSCGGSYLCKAGTGYDGPTGLGSPLGAPNVELVKVPHYYQNLSTIEEGKKVPYISWGRLGFTTSSGGAPTECEVASAGYVENPKGANAGEFEKTGAEADQAFDPYNCANEECTAAGGNAEVLAEHLPWTGVLTEPVPGPIRLANTGVQLYLHCRVALEPPSENPGTGSFKGQDERTSIEYNLPGPATCSTTGGGTSTPREINGTSAEKPSKSEFTAGLGGELECGAGSRAAMTGSLKLSGYQEAELISAKVP